MEYDIAEATKSDLACVLDWLKEEYKQRNNGTGFWCNRSIIEKQFQDRDMLVLREDGLAVAFLSGGITTDGILAVKLDKRRSGCGRALAEYGIEQARKLDQCVLIIEAANDSNGFWEKLGFKRVPRKADPRQLAYMLLPRTFQLPASGRKLAVKFALYPEEVKWNPKRSH